MNGASPNRPPTFAGNDWTVSLVPIVRLVAGFG